jgi:hypothetical protein
MKITRLLNTLFLLIISVCSSLLIVACSDKKESVTEKAPEMPSEVLLIQKREIEAMSKTYDEFGELVATISYLVRPSKEDAESGDADLIPWISLERLDAELDRLIEPDEIVVLNREATLLIDYPLNNLVWFDLISENEGFTRKQLAVEISKKYHALYIEEEETASVKTIPPDLRKVMLNRNETNGKYGIWGHDLGDLALREIEVRKNHKGKIILGFKIES